jgi:hypothetical protein
MVNEQWTQGYHEWVLGVGPASLLLLVAGLWTLARQRPAIRNLWQWAAICSVLTLPIWLNWYQPGWNAFLKSLPVFGSSSSLLRWFALYLLPCIVFSGLAFDRVAASSRNRTILAILVTIGTITWSAWNDFSVSVERTYDARVIQHSWKAVRTASAVPAVKRMTANVGPAGEPLMELNRNDALVSGESQLLCYSPMFGYRDEKMPFGLLRTGPALAEDSSGRLNVRNPSCILYPAENRCQPGDRYRHTESAIAERFLAYKSFAFNTSTAQKLASLATHLSLVMAAVAWLVVGFRSLIGR